MNRVNDYSPGRKRKILIIFDDMIPDIMEYNEFEEMSLDSKYNKMKKFTNLLTNFKNLKPEKPEMQLKKERIMKNVDEL